MADPFYVGVCDVNFSTAWHIEKLGLKKSKVDLDEGEGCIALVFPKDLATFAVLGPVTVSADQTARMFYSGAIDRPRNGLDSRGVRFGAMEADRQGTRYFAMEDGEGIVIEVSEEP